MEPPGVSLLESGVWIIPLAILSVVVGLAIWIRWTQGEISERLKPLLPRLNACASALRQIRAVSEAYAAVDREPFRSQKSELDQQLADTQAFTLALKQTYVELQDRLHRRQMRFWQLLLGGPFLWAEWRGLGRQSAAISAAMGELEAAVQDARARLQVLDRAGQQVAGRVQTVLEIAAQAGKLLDSFADLRLGGEAFEQAAAEDEALSEALAEIPEAFLRTDEQAQFRQADLALIADVYAILSQTQPRIEALLQRLLGWQQEHQQAQQAASSARGRLDALRQLLVGLPPGLETHSQSERLQEMESQVEALMVELSAPNLARLPAIQQAGRALAQAAESMSSEVRLGRRQFFGLAALLEELSAGQRVLGDLYTQAARHPRLPIQWENGRERLMALNREIAALGGPAQARPLEAVGAQLEQARALLERQKELTAASAQVLENQAQLARLLASPQADQGLPTVRLGLELAGQASQYALQNWSRKEGLESLEADLRAQEGRLRSLIPGEAVHPLLETDLEDYLAAIEDLVADQQALEARMNSAGLRLQALRTMENEARERGQQARTVLSQVLGLASGNEFLLDASRLDLDRLRSEVDQRLQALEQRRQGTVEKKALAVQQLNEEIERLSAGWLERLNKDIENFKRQLAEKLSRLQEIAHLDDPEVERAAALLAQDLQSSVAARSRQEKRLLLSEVVAALKPRNDLWQDCRIALAKLGERVEGPLVEAFHQAQEQRSQVQNLLAEAGAARSRRRSWPPSASGMEDVRPEVERLEARWQEVRAKPAQAIWAVRRYGELAVAYRTLADQITQIGRKAELEQTRLQAQEAEIWSLFDKWELQEQALANDPDALGRSRRLRSSIERRLQDTKRRWEREDAASPGSITYAQIQQLFQEMAVELKNARLLVGDDQNGWREVNIQGESHPVIGRGAKQDR